MFLLDLLSVVAFSRIFDFFENHEVMDLWSTITAGKNHEVMVLHKSITSWFWCHVMDLWSTITSWFLKVWEITSHFFI